MRFPPRTPALLLGCVSLFITQGLIAQDKPRVPDDATSELVRMKYNNPDAIVDVGVGLWAWPLPMDADGDGDYDLVISCPDYPYNGTYFFENTGATVPQTPNGTGTPLPLFEPGVRWQPALKNVSITYHDGQPNVMVPGQRIVGLKYGSLGERQRIYPTTRVVSKLKKVRANQWSEVDYDGDGDLDLIVAHGLWNDYGWDNAFDDDGNWTNGPLRGHIWMVENTTGKNEKPKYAEPAQLNAGGKPIDVYGMPSPNFADFDGDGDLDLLCGEFVNGFTYFQNTGSRTAPVYTSGRELMLEGEPLAMPLCMIVATSIDWDRDGDVDLIVGQEDGRVAFLEHTGSVADGQPVFKSPVFFQQRAHAVKFGALVTPVSVDWDNDGDEDLLCGNTAGEIGFIENLDGKNPPKWAPPVLLQANGETIRIRAGENGSIQGPAESEWGYTTIDVADWDHDGKLDILANTIVGNIIWYRNIGTKRQPKLAAARPVRIAENNTAPKPAWNWWTPKPGEFATQWRTTPCVTDWNGDGLNDLVMLDHEGYLAFFRRTAAGIELPGERIFLGENYDSRHRPRPNTSPLLRLNADEAGRSGRRKIAIVDWDGDGKRDLLVNSANVDWLRQTEAKGNGDRVRFVDQGPLVQTRLAGHTTSPTTTDWDGDGQRELLIGAEDGFFYYVRPKAK